MLLSRSLWSKALVTVLAAVLFVWLLEVTMLDSKYVTLPLSLLDPAFDPTAPPAPGARIAFTATAYCKGMTTSSGISAQTGVTAADPTLLPVGSIVELDFRDDKYDGIYTVLDTGPAVQGREIDLYMWNCNEALRFGRRPVRMTVLRLGWNPHATTRGFMDRLFRKQVPPVDDPPPPPAPPPGTSEQPPPPAAAPGAPAPAPVTPLP